MATVAITGASGQVGTLLAERLAGKADIVGLGRADDWTAAIRAADAVAHLAGTLQPGRGDDYRSANVDTADRVAAAVEGSAATRIAFLSYVGADPASPNAYLAAKGAAEQILGDTGVPLTVFRCVHIFGPPEAPGPTAGAFIVPGRGPSRVPGDGKQRIAPLYIGDVVEALARALLDPDAPTGVFELVGPQEISMDEFAKTFNAPWTRLSHLPASLARLFARLAPSLTPELMELMLADNVGTGGRSAAEAFGLKLRSLADVWRPEPPA